MVLIAFLIFAVTAQPPDNAMQSLAQMQHLAAANPSNVHAVLEAGLAQLDTGQTRGDQCLQQYYQGELYRLAAAVDPDNGYAEQALACFRGMRIDFLDLDAGQLGYIGEARVLRQQGKPEESLLALKPLLEGKADPRLRRLAQLEAMEANLAVDPAAVVRRAKANGDGAQWLLARAYARTGRGEEALRLARADDVVAGVALYDRLALIAQLDALTDAERADWATLLVALGRQDQALKVLEGRTSQTPSALYAALLTQAGRHGEAARQWRLVADATADPKALLATAQSLEASSQPEAALTAYRRVVESQGPDELRHQALIGWLRLNGRHDSLEMLEKHRKLIGDDPYLRYALAAARLARGANQKLSEELDAIAQDADNEDLRAAARLLQAQAQPDPRAALQILKTHWALLSLHSATASHADHLRVRLWVELGMIDSAADAMAVEPQQYPADTLLKVAQALADRYRELPDAAQRQRILRLCDAALRSGGEDSAMAIAVAELMLRIEAYTDAYRVASALQGQEAQMLAGRALHGLDKPQEALDVLKDVASPQAAMIRGQCEMDLNQAEQAVGEFRVARRQTPVDSDAWWQATFALCRAQAALGHDEAAASVLRVSHTLHPLDDRPQLRQQLENLQLELQP